jgi:large subunit ribosomal protein L32
MASPKRRTSHSRKNKRRSHDAIGTMAVGVCKNCGSVRRPHRVCEECGYYGEKQVATGTED